MRAFIRQHFTWSLAGVGSGALAYAYFEAGSPVTALLFAIASGIWLVGIALLAGVEIYLARMEDS